MMMDVTIHNALLDKTYVKVNIGIRNGKIDCITEQDIKPGERAIDAQGGLVTPPFFEPHFHLDNTLISGHTNHSGTLNEAIKIYSSIKSDLIREDFIERSTRTLRQSLSHGVLWFRSHVDIEPFVKLRLVDYLKEVKEIFAGVIDVSMIAFPQLGMTRAPETVDLMYAAMELGADIVGGIPHKEKDMSDAEKHIELAFEIAKKYDADIDMHVDETDDPYWKSLELLAEKTIDENYQGRVSAGHCCSMAAWDTAVLERVLPKVREAEIHIINNVMTNLVLQGRKDGPPIRRGTPPLPALVEAGINITSALDDMANMFYPFGDMNPLHTANIAAHVGHMTSPELIRQAFEMPLYHAARMFRIEDYGIEEGLAANLVILPVSSEIDALRLHPNPSLVMRGGKVLYQREVKEQYNELVPEISS